MDKLNYGVIGNCCTAALISDKGSIDWLCFPNFDSPSIFASLLDREKGGYFGFEVSPDYQISQSYVPHTNILSTNFVSEENEFAVVDFMPCYHLSDDFCPNREIILLVLTRTYVQNRCELCETEEIRSKLMKGFCTWEKKNGLSRKNEIRRRGISVFYGAILRMLSKVNGKQE